MAGRFLLDTNILIALFARDDAVQQHLTADIEVFLPSIALGELYYGAYKSARAEANLARVDELAAASAVLACDGNTARMYGRIKDGLRGRGRPIPENDLWIAALVRQHGLTLATRDAHFDEVEQLSVATW